MDSSALTTLLEQLQAAVDSASNVSICEQLKSANDAEITVPLLKQVPIGKLVNKISSDESLEEETRTLASSCMSKWKALLAAHNSQVQRSVSTSSVVTSQPPVKRAKLETPITPSAVSAPAKPMTEDEKRSSKLAETLQSFFPDHPAEEINSASESIWTGRLVNPQFPLSLICRLS